MVIVPVVEKRYREHRIWLPMKHPLVRSKCKPQVGQHFEIGGRAYELHGKIGDGAVGLVRKARRLDSADIFAVKFLAPDPKYIDPSSFDDVARRFEREGNRGTHLDHINLLKVIGYADNAGGRAFKTGTPTNPFIVMEYVENRTLESFISNAPAGDRGTFTVTKERLGIAIQICHALEYLKEKKLVHRDVKPANIFLRTTPRPAGWLAKLGDFGVVKWGDFHAAVATGTLTATSQRGLGTLKYMSPEQAVRPKTVTIKSDIWSLGITLFELFTGQILASAHHVYEIQAARRAHGTTWSRFTGMEITLPNENSDVADLVLEMFLAADGRPPIEKIRGRLEFAYESRFDRSWLEDS
jgi:eukaryotic-like serine/threonine-protein kinase